MATYRVDSEHPQFSIEFSTIFGGDMRETQLLSYGSEVNKELTSRQSILFYQR